MADGRLIVLEGAEGAGKTTQARRLVNRLFVDLGVTASYFREPGGTPLGERIRQQLLEHHGSAINDRAELLLFLAARAQLAADLRTLIASGVTIVLDRFFLSTYAYQIAGRGLPEDEVRGMNEFATEGIVPDLTLVLTLPADHGLKRAVARALGYGGDRIEQSGVDFHERVAAAFAMFLSSTWQQDHPESGRIVGIDARGTEDDVAARIWTAVTEES